MTTRAYLRVIVAAAAATIMLAGLSLVSATRSAETRPQAPTPAVERARLFPGVPQHGLALGAARAPVTLVEYADLQCPYCAVWARDTLPVLVDRYVRTGKVRIVFHGLAFLGPDSVSGLTAVLAAGRQDRLWDLLEGLYERQGVENSGWLTAELLSSTVDGIAGLDARALARDRAGAPVEQQMQDAAAAADRAGIRGTPSFELGRTGGPLRVVSLSSLAPDGLTPSIDRLLP